MKKIEAVIQPFKLDAVREILAKAKLPRINIFEVKGAGNQQGLNKAIPRHGIHRGFSRDKNRNGGR